MTTQRYLQTAWSRPLAAIVALTSCFLLGADARSADKDGPAASSPPPDKSRYNLFHPTPENLLRPFDADRPDQTSGARSVDAGHVSLETSFFQYELDLGASRTDTWTFLPDFSLRVGLTNSLELGVSYGGVSNRRTRELQPGAGGRRSDATVTGGGSLTVRLRQNIFGNDQGDVAFAIIPVLTLPTSTRHLESSRVQPSVILPVSFGAPGDFDVTVHTEFGAFRNEADTHYELNVSNGLTVAHDLLKDRIKGYVEFFDTLTVGPQSTLSGQADAGLIWLPRENLQFDLGCNFGVTRDAPDYQPFAGMAVRF